MNQFMVLVIGICKFCLDDGYMFVGWMYDSGSKFVESLTNQNREATRRLAKYGDESKVIFDIF